MRVNDNPRRAIFIDRDGTINEDIGYVSSPDELIIYPFAAEAFRLGASGYLLKNSAASELVHAIQEVLLARSYVTPLMTKDMVGSFIQNFKRRKVRHELTLRQREVLQLLAEGRSMKEVAYHLNVTPRTVAFHKYTMMDQLQLKSSAELIQYALKSSLAGA